MKYVWLRICECFYSHMFKMGVHAYFISTLNVIAMQNTYEMLNFPT